MGDILHAKCPCGFEERDLPVGGGWANFTTYCGAPAFCDTCGTLQLLNYLDPPAECPECGGNAVFYNDPSLYSLPPEDVSRKSPVFWWRTSETEEPFVLPDAEYLCPSCRDLSMRFVPIGNWD